MGQHTVWWEHVSCFYSATHTRLHTHTQKKKKSGFEIFAGWKLISLLCSLNGPVPFLLIWIPDPPVQPEEALSGPSPPMKRYKIQFPFLSPFFPFYWLQLQFQIASSSHIFLPPPPILSSVVHFATADKWSSLLNTKEYSEVSHPAQRGGKNASWCFFLFFVF